MSEETQLVGQLLYDIEVEKSEQGFITYELVTKTGGSVRDDRVDGRNPAADMGFNSKDYNFIPVICELGLGSRLKELIEKHSR